MSILSFLETKSQ